MLLPRFASMGKLRPCLFDPNSWTREDSALEAYKLFPILCLCDNFGRRSSCKKILWPTRACSFTDLISILQLN